MITLEQMMADNKSLIQPFSSSNLKLKHKRLLRSPEEERLPRWETICKKHEVLWKNYYLNHFPVLEPIATIAWEKNCQVRAEFVLSQRGVNPCKISSNEPLTKWLESYKIKIGLEKTWNNSDFLQPRGVVQLFKKIYQTELKKANQLILPILSMRDKSNGKYRLLADGNVHMVLNRYFDELTSNKMALAVPIPEQLDDLYEFRTLFHEIELVFVRHGYDITETRKYFWQFNDNNIDWSQWEKVIVGIPGCEAQSSKWKNGYEFMLNVSSQEGINQKCDFFQTAHLLSCSFDSCQTVWVYDRGQFEALPKSLQTKTLVNRDVCNMKYYNRITTQKAKIPKDLLVVPHRFEDPLYDWDKIEKVCTEWEGKVLFLNPTCSDYLPEWFDGKKMSIQKLSKQQYVALLRAKPTILYVADDRVMHITQNELQFFDCNIIGA